MIASKLMGSELGVDIRLSGSGLSIAVPRGAQHRTRRTAEYAPLGSLQCKSYVFYREQKWIGRVNSAVETLTTLTAAPLQLHRHGSSGTISARPVSGSLRFFKSAGGSTRMTSSVGRT